VSNFNASQMRRIQPIAPISSLQPPYSLLDRAIEDEVLPFCQQNNIGTIVYAPMGSGLLTGTWTPERVENLPPDDMRRRKPDFHGSRLARNIALADLLREIGQAHGRTAGETAIAWTLRHPAVTAAIVGGRRPAQIDEIIGAADFRLNQEEIEQLEAFLSANP
jgi:aryl-alcohol dehydrogenase-like predicted oxidoreductase